MPSVSSPVRTVVRASSYNIYVDLEVDREHVLIIHGYTGAYDLVSANASRWLRALDRRPPKPLYGSWSDQASQESCHSPSSQTIDLLTRRGYLTQLTIEEERDRFDHIVEVTHKRSLSRAPLYVVMPTYDCNLRCAYCFQDHMRTDSRYSRLLRCVDVSTVDRIVGSFSHIERHHGIVPDTAITRNVLFFGGEPLLRTSHTAVSRMMDKVRSMGPAVFTAVSNATELEAFADRLGPDGISRIQITLDGPRQRHDERRIYSDGSGSFEKIVANIDLALSLGVYIDVRMNIDKTNLNDIGELANFFVDRRWVENPQFSAYAAAVHGSLNKTGKGVLLNSHELSEKMGSLAAQVPAIAHIATPNDALRWKFQSILGRGAALQPPMKASYCGAHSGMYVDAFCDIYACWERTGDPNLRVGHIEENGSVNFVGAKLAEWHSRNVTSNETCAQCRYSMYCGGGCAVLAEGLHGTVYGNYCDAFARRFRQTLAETYSADSFTDALDEHVVSMRNL